MIGVTYIADAPIPSAAANCVQVLHMSAALAAAGCDVSLFAPWASDRLSRDAGARRVRDDFAVLHPVPVRYMPYVSLFGRGGGSYYSVAAVAALLSRRRIVMTRNPRVAALSARLGLDVVLESHTPPTTRRPREALSSLVASGRLALWVFISDRLKELHAEWLRPHTPVVTLHDAVDIERFSPMSTREEARERLGVRPAGPVVLHAGSLYKGRGAEELVAALDGLGPQTELWFVGGRAADVERVRRGVPEGRAARVRFFGHRPPAELPNYLFAADVLVLASTSKGTAVDGTNHVDYSSPMKLFEYFAAGRPIVTTALAGVREVVDDGDNALLATLDDTAALVGGVQRVLGDPALAARLSEGARRTAEQRTWRARADAIVERIA